jgi:DNA-binding response OmpR family regulator
MTVPLILIVDNNRSDLEQLARQLAEEEYETLGVSNLDEMDSAIETNKNIKLILLYLAGFDDSIWKRCDRMHEVGIPFIAIMPQRSPGIQRESMKHGANGLLVQPLGIKELVEHIHAALGD